MDKAFNEDKQPQPMMVMIIKMVLLALMQITVQMDRLGMLKGYTKRF